MGLVSLSVLRGVGYDPWPSIDRALDTSKAAIERQCNDEQNKLWIQRLTRQHEECEAAKQAKRLATAARAKANREKWHREQEEWEQYRAKRLKEIDAYLAEHGSPAYKNVVAVSPEQLEAEFQSVIEQMYYAEPGTQPKGVTHIQVIWPT